MPTIEHLEGGWREWRHARLATLTRPYGWTALVAQHWLREGDEHVALDGLPGTWSVRDGRIIFTPPGTGANLSVDGEYPGGDVEIVPGRNQSFGHFGSVPVYFGAQEVETIVRTDDSGARVFAVRVRDPRQSAQSGITALDAYPYDPGWRVPVTYRPATRTDVEQITVETGVRETTTLIGSLDVTLDGEHYELAVIGKDSARGVRPVLHLRDATSATTTYGAGRVLELDWAHGADGERIEIADFNYLHALPCAFTSFVTCPIPPAGNHLPIPIEAGEKRPARTVDRVLTFLS